MRRRHQHHPLGAGGQPRQGRPEQAQFAQASGRDEYFAERGLGPATTGQGRIQGGKAGGLVAAGRLRTGLALPDPPLVEQGIEGNDSAHQA
ncbi:hypothetical protein D3C81_2024730 [compost metagenome]